MQWDCPRLPVRVTDFGNDLVTILVTLPISVSLPETVLSTSSTQQFMHTDFCKLVSANASKRFLLTWVRTLSICQAISRRRIGSNRIFQLRHPARQRRAYPGSSLQIYFCKSVIFFPPLFYRTITDRICVVSTRYCVNLTQLPSFLQIFLQTHHFSFFILHRLCVPVCLLL